MKTRKALRRAGSILLAALAALSCLAVPAGAATVGDFTDVSSSSWYYDAVKYATEKRLFDGTSATQFSPDLVMTRGMFIKVLGRYAGVEESAWRTGTVTGSGVYVRKGAGTEYGSVGSLSKGAAVTLDGRSGDWYKIHAGSLEGYVSAQYIRPGYHGFSDVDYGQYYAGYAIWAYAKGIVTGDGNADTFSPDGIVTREQVCALLNRYASVMGMTVAKSEDAATFPDDGAISSWAKQDVYAMQQAGVVKGRAGSGQFDPSGSATRAEVAAMFQRFESAAAGGQTPPPSSSTPPSDGPDAEGIVDTPATFLQTPVQTKTNVIRVGLFVETANMHTSVDSAVLTNRSGGGFEYGSMSGGQFLSAGTVEDSSVTVRSSGGSVSVYDPAGEEICSSSSAVALHPLGDRPTTKVEAGKSGNSYFGDFELRPAYGKSGYVTVINYVSVEDYVRGVIPYEFGYYWPVETLKAAAIASRSHIMTASLGVYDKFGMDIVANDGSQLYRGRANYDESHFSATDAAVDATKNVYLTYNGQICVAAYSACDGGQIRSASEVFGNTYAYLVSKADPYEQAAKGEISGYEGLVSASHKVGMSQWGAYAMAQYYQKDYQTILGFYYPGTNLQYGA